MSNETNSTNLGLPIINQNINSSNFSYNLINNEKENKNISSSNSEVKIIAEKTVLGDSDDEKRKEINEMWNLIENQICDNYLKPIENKNPNCIRVFVSSTFTDFFNEREILVKKVFEELREWCYVRGLDLIECDLRWGVPIYSNSNETILTCLNELDRCYEENNGQPFFIGMIGEKYGWVPDITSLSNEIKSKYNWVPKTSITFIEFLHGALRSKNKNACFFIRNKDSLRGIPNQYNEKFFENDSYSKLQLQIMKEKLKKYHPNQVFEYSCRYEGIDNSTGRDKVKLSELDHFAKQALKFLKKSIQESYPNKTPIEGKFEYGTDETIEREISFQKIYWSDKLKFNLKRKNEVDAILNFIDNEETDIIKLDHKMEIPFYKCLLILGEYGIGSNQFF